MGKVIRILFTFSSGPILIRKGRNRYMHGDMLEFDDQIFNQPLQGCEADRKNMRGDVLRLRDSFNQSIKEAEEELAN